MDVDEHRPAGAGGATTRRRGAQSSLESALVSWPGQPEPIGPVARLEFRPGITPVFGRLVFADDGRRLGNQVLWNPSTRLGCFDRFSSAVALKPSEIIPNTRLDNPKTRAPQRWKGRSIEHPALPEHERRIADVVHEESGSERALLCNER